MGEVAIRHVVVVIPACNEEESVSAGVSAVAVAAAELPSSVRSDVVVVANGCTDGTAAAAREAGAHVLVVPVPNVGAARALGCAWALTRCADLGALWIATTDADSMVPHRWLAAQIDEATRGVDLFLGTVTLDAADLARHPAWARGYLAREEGAAHEHVHGANLGVRAAAYVRAGGFHDLAVHEDRDLVERLLESGAAPSWSEQVPVATSARHASRVTGGVGSDLAASS